MATRFLTPYSGRLLAVCVAAWLLVASLASPVFASSPPAAAGDSQKLSPPDVPADQLRRPIFDQFTVDDAADEDLEDPDASFVPANYLTPEVESALREALLEDLEKNRVPPADAESASDDGGPTTIKARMPGLSDVELKRYKRQMYRRDI